MHELADAVRDVTQGLSGRDALEAGAQAMRTYVLQHPGRYAAGNAARLTGLDDPLLPAVDRLLASWTAMLQGYHLAPDQQVRALRMLRSMLHGFASRQQIGSFQMDADVDESFAWMTRFIDRGLTSAAHHQKSTEARA